MKFNEQQKPPSIGDQPQPPKVRKCPKCRQAAELYHEVWSGEQREYGVNPDGSVGVYHDVVPGDPHHVEAECGCGHRWRLRGVRQLTDLQDKVDQASFTRPAHDGQPSFLFLKGDAPT